jgi:NADH dehydrogenase
VYRDVDTRGARVLLVAAGDRILPAYGDKLSASAERQLRSLGVTPQLESRVTEIDAGGITLATGEHIPARTKIWAAGVAASELARLLADAAGLEVDQAGRITVEPDLTLPGHREVFAFGDMVVVRGLALHGVAPVAMQQGRHVGRSISRDERTPFSYNDKGELATIGRARAVGRVKGLRVTGFIAWAMWLGIHIVYLVGLQNRLVVLTRWAFAYVTRGRGARVIHRG